MKLRILSALYGALMIAAVLHVNTAVAQHLTFTTYSGQSEITASGSITFGPGFTVPAGSSQPEPELCHQQYGETSRDHQCRPAGRAECV
jgi:hypothetical protein